MLAGPPAGDALNTPPVNDITGCGQVTIQAKLPTGDASNHITHGRQHRPRLNDYTCEAARRRRTKSYHTQWQHRLRLNDYAGSDADGRCFKSSHPLRTTLAAAKRLHRLSRQREPISSTTVNLGWCLMTMQAGLQMRDLLNQVIHE
jgi:hypothetical protein